MNTTSLPYLITAAAAVSLLLGACGNRDTAQQTPSDKPNSASAIPPSLVTESPPAENPLTVVEARAKAKPGEAITLRGKVGGKIKPIADSGAVLVLADEEAITSCDKVPGDSCPTPWDFCCEESATIAASTATIQVLDADDKLIRSTLRDVGGLKELSHLIVSGTVDDASSDAALIVNAEHIHVETP